VKLIGISYSPWSLRAKWALRHHGIPHDWSEYLPMVSTPLVRREIGAFSGPITVPILVGDGFVLRDSFDIARYADEHGSGAPLFAVGEESARRWTTIAEDVSDPGRVLTTRAVLADKEAMLENVPSFVPRAVRAWSRPLVSTACVYLAKKYRFDARPPEEHRRRMQAALREVASVVEAQPYLEGDAFGFADMAVACSLQFVRPHPSLVRLGPATARAWTRADLLAEVEPVLAWRDQVVEKHWRGAE